MRRTCHVEFLRDVIKGSACMSRSSTRREGIIPEVIGLRRGGDAYDSTVRSHSDAYVWPEHETNEIACKYYSRGIYR